MTFPAEAAPDGWTLLLHHYTYAVAFALFGAAVVWDDYRRREPVVVGLALLVGLLGFVFGWNTSPELGAVAALLGATVPIVVVVVDYAIGLGWVPWTDYRPRWAAWVVAWCVVALDDAVSHAFGVWTPLDWFWGAYLWPVLG